jgi:hypothetical protein
VPRLQTTASALRFAPSIVAGALLLGAGAAVTAQEGTPVPIEAETEIATPPAALPGETGETSDLVGSGSQPSTVPSTGVGPGLTGGGTGPLSLGALVGAGVAALFALRERLRNR